MVPRTAPHQQRSRQTYEALLASAERLLRQKSFQNVSLLEICEGANCTTGAFYHRFSDKDALLAHLEDRIYERAHSLVDDVFLSSRPRSGRELLRRLITAVVDYYAERQGAIRAMILAAQSDPEVRQRHARRGAGVWLRGRDLLVERLGVAGHDPRRSLEFALVGLRAVLREMVLFRDEGLGRFPRDVLITELTEQFTRYLGLKGGEW